MPGRHMLTCLISCERRYFAFFMYLKVDTDVAVSNGYKSAGLQSETKVRSLRTKVFLIILYMCGDLFI